MKVLLFEIIGIWFLFTIIFIYGSIKHPTQGLHNLPINIQKKVHSLDEYKDLPEILTPYERIIRKWPAILVILIIIVVMIYFTNPKNFLWAFLYSFILWVCSKLFVVFVLQCGLYAHTPKLWIPHTEDMKEEYRNYRFYLSSIPRSLLVGFIISLIVGFIIQVIYWIR